MNKDKFIKIAKEYGYRDEDIDEMVELVETAKCEGISVTFEYVANNVLAEQPQYQQ